MSTIFLACAIVGGTILACQLLLTLAGLGDHGVDVADSAAHDVPHDLGHDLAHDAGASVTHAGDAHDQGDGHAHSSTWLFGVLTFRTLVAAVTFFGIAGMAAHTADLSVPTQLLIAMASGVAALGLVHWIMRTMYGLGEDHTVRINRAVGQEGTVYIPIPGDKAGAGKIQLSLQGRLMEYEATTSKAALPAGARVVVVGVAGSGTLEVEPVLEHTRETIS